MTAGGILGTLPDWTREMPRERCLGPERHRAREVHPTRGRGQLNASQQPRIRCSGSQMQSDAAEAPHPKQKMAGPELAIEIHFQGFYRQ